MTGNERCVWYLETRDGAGRPLACGSAVLIFLEDAVGSRAPYLLTCRHVVQSAAEVMAWAPGRPYVRLPDFLGVRPCGTHADHVGGILVRVVESSIRAGRAEGALADDWDLLEFLDSPAWLASQEGVQCGDGLNDDEALVLVGYPGGSRAWQVVEQEVRPVSSEFRYHRTVSDSGLIVSTGGESRPGMSGGGVFTKKLWVGLHREARDLSMERRAVPAATIVASLEQVGLRLARPSSRSEWPGPVTIDPWPASNQGALRAKVPGFLTSGAPKPILLVEGPSESGKTMAVRHMLGLATRLGLRRGTLDFKGGANLDDELDLFAEELGLGGCPGDRFSGRLGKVLEALRKSPEPTLLIFDSFEQAGSSGRWIERSLLQTIHWHEWLRVALLGTRVPEPQPGAVWADHVELARLEHPTLEDWEEWRTVHTPDYPPSDLEAAYRWNQNPSVLYALLRRSGLGR